MACAAFALSYSRRSRHILCCATALTALALSAPRRHEIMKIALNRPVAHRGRLPTFLVLGAITAALSGCDFVYGVNRSAQLDALPSLDCVRQAIQSTPGIETVDERSGTTFRELTFSGLHPPDPIYYFNYRGPEARHIRGVVQLTTNWRGYVDFTDYNMRMNEKPPQAEIDATRPVMREIERRLSDHCGVTKLQSPIHEWCHGVKCK